MRYEDDVFRADELIIITELLQNGLLINDISGNKYKQDLFLISDNNIYVSVIF